jgi:hypothetical protein
LQELCKAKVRKKFSALKKKFNESADSSTMSQAAGLVKKVKKGQKQKTEKSAKGPTRVGLMSRRPKALCNICDAKIYKALLPPFCAPQAHFLLIFSMQALGTLPSLPYG